MKNYERIQGMEPELLTFIIICPNEAGLAKIECDHSYGKDCFKCIYDWLMQEEK